MRTKQTCKKPQSLSAGIKTLHKNYKGITLRQSPPMCQAEIVRCEKCKYSNRYHNASFMLNDTEFLKRIERNFKHFRKTHVCGKGEAYES